jgi:asparagine synthase (glutamine-hydrolysing)
MSAQAGVWNFDQASASREILANISETIAQYGPDGESTYFKGAIGMLYRPFHTTKESRLERQPFVSQRGYAFTWDGRLDNRETLIPQLQCDLNPEQTDLAIVVAAFHRWGTDCFRKLVGDWALAVWNPTQKVLVLARDYIGVRQLYYYPTPRRVIWCTHLASLVLSGDSFSLDEEYVAGYLALYPEAHLTPYREIRAVPPGSFVSIQPSGSTVQPYWAFNPKQTIRYKTDTEYEQHFRKVFRQAVRRRLRSDSPILAELSGGLDSSSIVCMADDILVKEGAETPRLDTLSYYDPGEPDGDERPFFTKVEEKRGRKGHCCNVGIERTSIPVCLPHFVCRPGELGDEGTHTAEFRQRLRAKHGYRVLLSGIGGDEFLGGIPNPTFQLADLIQQLRFIELARQLIAWSLQKKRPWAHLLGQAWVSLLPAWAQSKFTQEASIEPWIDAGFSKRYRLAHLRLGPLCHLGFRLSSRVAYARTIVLVSRQQSCAIDRYGGGTEQRFPYLDQDLLEYLLAIPSDQLLRPGVRRSLMRRALAGLLPTEILNRQTKAVTVRKYMNAIQRNYDELHQLVDRGYCSRFGFISSAEFIQCLIRAKNGNAPQLVRLIKAIALELWLRDVTQRGLIISARENGNLRELGEVAELGLHA